ncbi:VWA domain-containing protein [Blastopirellula sp. JC732]|uniref:VWA domain-containing protein n=1 Tax=Blastopirellula sediminis TaxID=2894196 RepID=A0A9X1SIY6_9BACT|nr:vWA domain-containing protein [Blastopirellula sediminis]MCC9604933.1 VWA domain-containing protein [Blastopirellula sediminis]MCC9631767.1 VWA domain-containing protein [Blastopirellula sediminis]
MDTPDPQFDDLDEILRRTPTPPDLAARLQAASQVDLTDGEIDEALRDISVPYGLADRILHSSRNERARRSDRQPLRWQNILVWGTAACLLVSASFRGWQATKPTPEAPIPSIAVAPEPIDTAVESLAWLGPVPDDLAIVDLAQHLREQPTSNVDTAGYRQLDWDDPTQPPAKAIPPQLVHLASDLPSNLMADAFLMRWKPLGARPLIDAKPREIQRAPSTDQMAEFFSLAPGYDRQFLLREEEQPFISLPNDKLNSITAPLAATRSWREAVRQITVDTGVPQPIRLEELAALGGAMFIKAERQQVALRTAAGPAAFANSGVQLLQVGMIAGSADIVDRPPTHLTIAVDLTAGMKESGRWDSVRQALGELIERMSPYDTVSLVCIDEFSHTLVEDATSADAAAWRETLQQMTPNDSDCLAEGIRFSSAVALRTASFGDIRRPLIVISDRFDHLSDATCGELEPLIDDANSQQVDYHWFTIDNSDQYGPLSKFWREVGSVVASNDERSLLRGLEQVDFGKSTCLATDLRLTVHWNVKSVASYRLVGCQVEAAGLGSGQQPLELHGEEAASALFEVVLTPDGPNEVARVEATWQDPATGKPKKEVQVVSRLQFAPSWEASPLSLQAAQLAVQAGGLMRESYFVRQRGGDASELSSMLGRANRQLARHDEFAYLEQLIRATERRRTNGF